MREAEGEAYRDRLLTLTADLGLTDAVSFDGRYLSGPELRAVVRQADVILLPYDSLEQVTSGVLTEAVAAGKPVISTSFPHAVELLSGGAGALVPRRDPVALADALEQVLTAARRRRGHGHHVVGAGRVAAVAGGRRPVPRARGLPAGCPRRDGRLMADPRYDHLARLTTARGLYEHAMGIEPRVEHGMCVDDVARGLVVTCREAEPTPEVVAMSRTYLTFLLRAQDEDGLMHNRSDDAGRWLDEPSTDDHWGRALWAFGTAATRSTDAQIAAGGRVGAERALLARSPHPRAMAYAALGAVQLLPATPFAARRLLHDARLLLQPTGAGKRWAWPYDRLTYANAVLPEAMIEIGCALHDEQLRHDGLMLLGWLEDQQTVGDHLSVVPAGGRGPRDRRPAFDQQPIEVAALAEAARSAFDATHDDRWTVLLARCEAWFEGANDGRLPMRDTASGGAFDGLEDGSVNQNQGAESTLAWLATSQLARERVPTLAPVTP